MKKILLLFISVLVFSCSQQKKEENQASEKFPKRAVVVMNPTVANLKTFQFLRQNKILDIPDSVAVIGFYHAKQNYDFERSQKYINENNLTAKLVECNAPLSPENIYEPNDCDSLFRYVFNASEGVFFFGGPDISGKCFGAKTHLMASVSNPYRNFFELAFLNRLLGSSLNQTQTPWLESKPDYVIAGFCLGMQTMNCATGGTMIQDIPMEVYNLSTAEDVLATPNAQHTNYNSYFDYDDEFTSYVFHKIKPVGKNYFTELIGNAEPFVLSAHHQAARNVGKGFEVAATSPDGKIIEAIIHVKYPHVVGVQFHPEHTSLYKADSKIKIKADDNETNYLNLYGAEKGETFHRNFWKMIGEWLNVKK